MSTGDGRAWRKYQWFIAYAADKGRVMMGEKFSPAQRWAHFQDAADQPGQKR